MIINPDTGKPITEMSLRQKFERELATGALKANANVTQSLYKNAIGGNVAAQIWWTKCRMGWKEVKELEVSGPNKGPIKSLSVTMTVQEMASFYARTMGDEDANDFEEEQKLLTKEDA